MESNLLSISKIFTERLFRIPDYQRGYAWTEKHLKDFYNDLVQLEKGKNHYTGVLTLENVPNEKYNEWEDDLWIIESRSYHPYYIVDGQQRLTTTIILIKSILEAAEKYKTLNHTSLDDIRKRFIFDSKEKGISRSYIFGYEKDNPSYEFLKTVIFEEESETSNQKHETIYTNNLIKAKKYFLSKLKDLSKPELERLYRDLTQNFLFNIYTITSDIDVFVVFETLNNRGKPLSHLELLKNRLIYLSTKLDDDVFEKKKLRRKINECWKSIYHNLGRNKDNPLDDDTFLINHFMIYFGNELWTKKELRSRGIRLPNFQHYRRDKNYLLEKKFTTNNIRQNNVNLKDIDNYVSSLQKSVETWYKIFNPKTSGYQSEIKIYLDKISRQGRMQTRPLIMTFFQSEKRTVERVKFLKALERLIFIAMLFKFNYILYEREEIEFLRLAIELNSKGLKPIQVTRRLQRAFAKDLTIKNTKENLVREFEDSGFYGWKGVRYLLFEYDLFLAENSKTNRKKLIWEEFSNRDYETVEHIYPQNARAKCWIEPFKGFSTKEKNKLRDSLGNLLPLSRAKNSSLQNKCFKDKIGSVESTIGFRFGCYSENEVTKHKNWTSKEILSRGLHLLEFMEKRWNIKLGSENDKIRLLGLKFLKKSDR